MAVVLDTDVVSYLYKRDTLVTNAPPRDREVELAKARARTALRFRGAPAV